MKKVRNVFLSLLGFLCIGTAATYAQEKTEREKYLEEALKTIRFVCMTDRYYPDEKLCPDSRQMQRIITKILNGTWDGFKGCAKK